MVVVVKRQGPWFSVEHGRNICLQVHPFPKLIFVFCLRVYTERSCTLWSPRKYSLLVEMLNWWAWDGTPNGWEQNLERGIRNTGSGACVGKSWPPSSQRLHKDLAKEKMMIRQDRCTQSSSLYEISHIQFPQIKMTNFLILLHWDWSNNSLVFSHENCKALEAAESCSRLWHSAGLSLGPLGHLWLWGSCMYSQT